MSLFQDFSLADAVLRAVADVGYEAPSPIQAASIPPLLEGRDLVGQAQTGTGKTAAFALPLLSRLDSTSNQPQILVLAPTRELAIQVAEAFQTYARHIDGFRILPVYGGQGMDTQLRGLKRGVQVIVGTPGRVIDHLKRKTLKLANLQALVLDEADEMLKMGFIDDVEWILEQSPESRQVALFSATLPDRIRKIARRHLNDPVEIKIKSKTSTVDTIQQRYWTVSGVNKLEALTRILEVDDFDGMIIFVRTKNATVDLAEKLEARGFSASALNGDMNQNLREKTIDRLKNKRLDILVATDVAARGLDVERISHVVNYDIPYDTEAYVHRIGRTGRAGREGHAILFVAPRETRMLRTIERATKQPITQMQLPTRKNIAERRIVQFKEQLDQVLADTDRLDDYAQVILDYVNERNALAARNSESEQSAADSADSETAETAAKTPDQIEASAITLEQVVGALTFLAQQERPFQFKPDSSKKSKDDGKRSKTESLKKKTKDEGTASANAAPPAKANQARSRVARDGDASESTGRGPRESLHEFEMERFRMAVGKEHGVEPGHIVGAIAGESGLDSRYIGEIKLYDHYSTVDLPEGIPKEILKILKKARVLGRKLELSPELQAEPESTTTVPGQVAKPRKPARKTAGTAARKSPGVRTPAATRTKTKSPKAKAGMKTRPKSAAASGPGKPKTKKKFGAKAKTAAKAKARSGVSVGALAKTAKTTKSGTGKKIRLKKKTVAGRG